MEENEDKNVENIDLKRPRKLNLYAPLLSTRRLGFSAVAYEPCSSNSLGTAQNTRVSFSWEQAPGKPKDIERSGSIHDGDTPRLRLPPCFWHPLKEASAADIDYGKQPMSAPIAPSPDSDSEMFSHNRMCGSFKPPTFQPNAANQQFLEFDQDDGCDGDDDDDDEKKNDVLSDAMDVLSLTEALDIVQHTEKAHSDTNEGLILELPECSDDQSPTYMINRFLLDDTALAASSSALNFSNDFNMKLCDTRKSYASSPKGCGMEILFPWRMKHKLCAITSPLQPYSTNVQKHQHSSKHKKHCSSVHKICTNNVKEDN